MALNNSFPLNPAWRVFLRDLGLSPQRVLKRAGLPADLWTREKATLDTDDYFRLWRGVEKEDGSGGLPLRFAEVFSTETFDAPLFAALCSPDLNTALKRLQAHKRLICPMALHLTIGPEGTTVSPEWFGASVEPPTTLIAFEAVFFVQLARVATRERICPAGVVSTQVLEPAEDYADYFGVKVQTGPRPMIRFRAADAAMPFLTESEEMWRTFEPGLRMRLAEIDRTATTRERVHAVLLETLPGGTASIAEVSRRLGTSTRTLQRKLNRENSSFQSVLNRTREDLARHYLKSSGLPSAEIAFLLGYEDPNSFFRAFQQWTGTTPEQARAALQAN